MKRDRASEHQEARLSLEIDANFDENCESTEKFNGKMSALSRSRAPICFNANDLARDHQHRRAATKPTSMKHRIFYMAVLYLVFEGGALWVTAKGLSDVDGSGDVNTFLGSETTTEFDFEKRGTKKFGDKCESTQECGFPGSICDSKKRSCQCIEQLPVTNHIDKCGKTASINESCFFNEQCEAINFQTECRDGRCIWRFEMSPTVNKDGTIECKVTRETREPERYIDPAMIGILAGMALMFIIICVVLRLFSRARWRENRTIFNTPNPRLMNVSLLRDNKLMHSQERRGSRISMRMPSRQPSMVSLRPHSPNPSLGSRRGSRNNSNTSAASTRSNRSGNSSHNLLNKASHHRAPTLTEANTPPSETPVKSPIDVAERPTLTAVIPNSSSQGTVNSANGVDI